MLLEGNQIAEFVYDAKKIICPLGIEVAKIHACKNICVLFCGDYADLNKCPKCGYDRYKRKNNGGDDNNADDENKPYEIKGKKKKANRGASVRVAWYFCIIPRLRRWFATRKEAQLLCWHDEGRKELKQDGKFRHPADAAQWGNINNHFMWFDEDVRSIQFAMSTDGVNTFSNQSSTHSTCPIVLSLYNLPPWLCKKHKYMMLKILVSGAKQPGDRTDVYLRPLVDDLKILWKPGVKEVWDEYKCEEFTMCSMLFTTINDNLVHRNLSGQSKRKDAVCPHCLEDTCAVWLIKTFKEMRINGAPSFPWQETSISGHGLSI
jgi:hypothetical protein